MANHLTYKADSSVNGTDDREAHPKFWIAAYTRPRSEKKVAAELCKSGIETYVPVQRQLRIWSDRKKFVDVPVIPMIIFAKISEKDIQIIRKHSLIIRIISQPGEKTPAHIPSEQVENLKFMLSQSDFPVFWETGEIKTDEFVRIIRGSLKGLVGKVREVTDNMAEIWMSIDMLGGAIIKIKSSDLEHFKE